MSSRIDNHWIITNNNWYCNRCWTIEFENFGVKQTSLERLREAYKNRTPQKSDETLFAYLKRALNIGSENAKNKKITQKEYDREALEERLAIQQEGTMATDTTARSKTGITFTDLESTADWN